MVEWNMAENDYIARKYNRASNLPQSKSGSKFAIGLIFLALVLGVTSNVICGIRCMWPGKHIIYVGQTIRTVHEHSMHKKHKYW